MKDGDIVQVAHVVRDLDKTLEKYWNDFHMGPWEIYTFTPQIVKNSLYRGKPSDHTYLVALAQFGGVQMEVMQPLTGQSIYDEFLEQNGEGLHHIKLYYADCAKAIKEEYGQKGYSVIQSGNIGEDEFYYLDTQDKVGGTIIELGNSGSIPPPERRFPA